MSFKLKFNPNTSVVELYRDDQIVFTKGKSVNAPKAEIISQEMKTDIHAEDLVLLIVAGYIDLSNSYHNQTAILLATNGHVSWQEVDHALPEVRNLIFNSYVFSVSPNNQDLIRVNPEITYVTEIESPILLVEQYKRDTADFLDSQSQNELSISQQLRSFYSDFQSDMQDLFQNNNLVKDTRYSNILESIYDLIDFETPDGNRALFWFPPEQTVIHWLDGIVKVEEISATEEKLNTIANLIVSALQPDTLYPQMTQTRKVFSRQGISLSDETDLENYYILQQAMMRYLDGDKTALALFQKYNIKVDNRELSLELRHLTFPLLLRKLNIRKYPEFLLKLYREINLNF